jgi:hypothetical protein
LFLSKLRSLGGRGHAPWKERGSASWRLVWFYRYSLSECRPSHGFFPCAACSCSLSWTYKSKTRTGINKGEESQSACRYSGVQPPFR